MREELLNIQQVVDKTGMCSSSVYRKIRLEGFPRSLPFHPSYPGKTRRGWKEKDIDKWVRRKEAPAITDRLRKFIRGWSKRVHHEYYRKPSGDNRI